MAMSRKSPVLGNRSRLRSLDLEFWVSAEQRKAGQVRNLENALIPDRWEVILRAGI
jgi:hypothetical protein